MAYFLKKLSFSLSKAEHTSFVDKPNPILGKQGENFLYETI